jgi:hypothetical protein
MGVVDRSMATLGLTHSSCEDVGVSLPVEEEVHENVRSIEGIACSLSRSLSAGDVSALTAEEVMAMVVVNCNKAQDGN